MSPPTHLVFPIVVWGDNYIDTFLHLALPTFLAAGNLPYCASRIQTKLVLISDKCGAERLNRSAIVRLAARTCEVEIRSEIEVPTDRDVNKYALMAAAHHSVIKELQGRHSIVGILSPDCLISDGSLKFALERIFEGFSSVLAAGPRAGLQGFGRELEGRAVSGEMALSSRELVALLCRNFHPISRSVFISTREFSVMPSCLYWEVSQSSFVARYFHLHPLMVQIFPDVIFPDDHQGTVDATLIDDANVSLDNSYVCQNSDELVIVEVTDESALHIPTRRIISKTWFIYRWSGAWANPRHVRAFLSFIFEFKGDDAPFIEVIRKANRDCKFLDYLLRRKLAEQADDLLA